MVVCGCKLLKNDYVEDVLIRFEFSYSNSVIFS